ncbi:SRPBCC family protein [Prosthecomicrobium sp. N25]|uniref:SRPBCC family protein n=1 Tax=Prosthecomicrobium sp. N25 TaxID=3129254 RepID=UPI00307708D4
MSDAAEITDCIPGPTIPPDEVLSVTRFIAAPPSLCFAVWTDRSRLTEWWGPHGMKTPVVEMDLRPGGVFRTEMEAPDGQRYRYQAVFLEIAEPERIVFTDALLPGWRPAAQTFIVSMTTFEPEDGGTRYTGRALHWTEEDRKRHEAMGFHDGWGASADRFKALVERVAREGR